MDKNAEIIKDSLEFKDVAESYGLKFDRSDFAICPFHNENTASFKVYEKGKYAHCFGCKWHGDVISFTRQLYNLSFDQAKRKLAEDFAVPVIFDRKMTVSESSNALANYNRDIMEYNKRVQDEREKQHHLYELMRIYETLRNWKEWYKPKNMDEPFDEHYVYAARTIDEAKWMIDLSKNDRVREV